MRRPRLRPDITGDAHHAAALLLRQVIRRLERGATVDEVRTWVDRRRQVCRYGSLAVLSTLTILDGYL